VLLSDSVKNKVATEHEYSLIHSQRSMKRWQVK
jgi:predicted MarR family transcription regulator